MDSRGENSRESTRQACICQRKNGELWSRGKPEGTKGKNLRPAIEGEEGLAKAFSFDKGAASFDNLFCPTPILLGQDSEEGVIRYELRKSTWQDRLSGSKSSRAGEA